MQPYQPKVNLLAGPLVMLECGPEPVQFRDWNIYGCVFVSKQPLFPLTRCSTLM